MEGKGLHASCVGSFSADVTKLLVGQPKRAFDLRLLLFLSTFARAGLNRSKPSRPLINIHSRLVLSFGPVDGRLIFLLISINDSNGRLP